MQRLAGNRAVVGAVEASVQRDACLIPKSKASPYDNLPKQGNVGPGENFDSGQRFAILAANFTTRTKTALINGKFDHQVSDAPSKKQLFDPTHLRPHAAEIDHIIPKEKGGGNSEMNAQVLGGDENVAKGTTYPWGAYSGARVYDPMKGKIFDSRTAAHKGGADLTTLNADFKSPFEKLVPL